MGSRCRNQGSTGFSKRNDTKPAGAQQECRMRGKQEEKLFTKLLFLFGDGLLVATDFYLLDDRPDLGRFFGTATRIGNRQRRFGFFASVEHLAVTLDDFVLLVEEVVVHFFAFTV